jgi:hypothetical protein
VSQRRSFWIMIALVVLAVVVDAAWSRRRLASEAGAAS